MRRSIYVVAVAAILAAAPAVAQETRTNLYNKFEFSPSLTSVILNSNIRVDSEDGSVGTDVDAEDDLGLEKVKWEPRFAMRWRPGHRHEIEFGYQFARRDAEKMIERDINFADTTFNAGLNLRTSLKTDLAFLNYRFAIITKENAPRTCDAASIAAPSTLSCLDRAKRWTMTSVSPWVWKIAPSRTSASRSSPALTRLPLWQTANWP